MLKATLKSMSTTLLTSAVAGVLPAAGAAAQDAPAGAATPNVLVILADDLGYGDLGCYNAQSKVPTPNLDRLAAGGMRFTNAYCPDAVCTPSRYALMTGRYAFRWRNKPGVLANWEPPAIEEGRLTLPGLMKQAGYTTGGFSKWHLGATYSTLDQQPPSGQGKFKSDNTGANLDINAPIQGGPVARGFDRWYGFVCASESLVFDQDRAVGRIDVYESPAAPGVSDLPNIPLAQYLPLATGKTIEFIHAQATAEQPKPFFVGYFPYVPHVPLAVADEFRGLTKGGDYGDYVHELDHYIGLVLAELDRTGVADNTIVIFASDNGSQFRETGQGHHPNGVLREGKYSIHEGGVRTPLIVRWPGRVAPGTTSEQIVALTDVMATCAAITGQTLPDGMAEDSISFLPALLGQSGGPGRDHVISRASDRRMALREGKWKFIPAREEHPAQLFDLEADPSEHTNLHDRHPDIVKRLGDRLKQLKTASGSR